MFVRLAILNNTNVKLLLTKVKMGGKIIQIATFARWNQ